jgi:hypothetical protein
LVRVDSVPQPLLNSSFAEGILMFTLQLQLQPPDGRQAFSQVTLTVKQSIRPIRISTYQTSTASAASSLTLNVGQRFCLLATDDRSNAPAQVRWSSNARALDLSNVAASVFGQSGSVLLLTGESLLGVMQLVVTARTEDAQASVVVKVNLPPDGGSCMVVPITGTETTLFTSSCTGVVDDDMPIKYSLRHWNVETGSVIELSTSLSATRQFMLPAGTLLVTPIACDSYQSCSDLKSTSVIVKSSSEVGVAQLNYMRDAVARSDIIQLLDSAKLLSVTLNALNGPFGKSKGGSRRLLQPPSNEVLSTLFMSMSTTVLNTQIALEFIKVLQALIIDRNSLASMDATATIETLNKLAGISSGWAGHATIASYLAATFEVATPRFIPSILSAMAKSSVRAAADVIVGVPLEYKPSQNAAWQMGVLSIMGVGLVNASLPLPWLSNPAFYIRPSILFSDRVVSYIRPADSVRSLLQIHVDIFPLIHCRFLFLQTYSHCLGATVVVLG